MSRLLDLSGRRFGLLTALRFSHLNRHGRAEWNCACDCGTEKTVASAQLMSGRTQSCGCLRKTNHPQKHGMSASREYAIWRDMIARCELPNRKGYANYGGQSVTVHPEWRRSFEAFMEHVGPRPSPDHSIDRIDPSGNYEPGNVRWATPEQQANNKRNTRYVVYRGRRLPLSIAVRMAGSVIHREAAWIRISRCGWTVEAALETPALFVSPNRRRKTFARFA